jgi:hypothetical protein
MYGNKRKEKKNKKNVIKMYKVTYLRALSAATKDTGGFLSILLRTRVQQKPAQYILSALSWALRIYGLKFLPRRENYRQIIQSMSPPCAAA